MAAGSVIAHARAIGFIKSQFAWRLTRPTPSTAPIRMCVLETGIPRLVPSRTTNAADSSAEKPEAGWIWVSLNPTVWMTSLPMNHRPAMRATPKAIIAVGGTVASDRCEKCLNPFKGS